MWINFKSIDVLQFPHKSYLQKGYFFCVYVVAKKKLLVIRISLNNKILLKTSTSLLQGNLSRYKKKNKQKQNHHDITEILLTVALNTIKQTNIKNGGIFIS